MIASMLPRCRASDLEEVLAQVHNAAGKLPFVADCDYAALVLEDYAEAMTDSGARRLVVRHAMWRARWCAQASTSGGEGHARSQHLQQLEAKLGADA
jgi:hypothetical protein